MREDTQSLYSLIHGLSSHERRYFTIDASGQQGSTPQFYRLYELILRFDIWSDEEIRSNEELAKFLQGKKLSVEKTRLQSRLIASLRRYDTNQTRAYERRDELSEIQVLESRGKVDMAASLLQILKKKALTVDAWHLILEILMIEIRLEKVRLRTAAAKKLESIRTERAYVMDQLLIQQKLRDVWDELLFQQWSNDKTQLPLVIVRVNKSLDFLKAAPQLAFTNQLYVMNIRGLLAILNSDLILAESAFSEVISLYIANPEWVEENLQVVMLQYYNYLNVAHRNRNYEVFPPLLRNLEAIERKLHHGDPGSIYYSSFLTVLYLGNTGKIRAALDAAKRQDAAHLKLAGSIPPPSYVAHCFNLFILQFLCEEFSEANKTLSAILSDNQIRIRIDLREALRIFDVLIQFELGNVDITENRLRSLASKRLQDPHLEGVIPVVIRIIKRLLKCPFDSQTYLIRAKGDLELLRIQQSSLDIQGMNEITLWLESKINRIPLLSVIDNRVKKGDIPYFSSDVASVIEGQEENLPVRKVHHV